LANKLLHLHSGSSGCSTLLFNMKNLAGKNAILTGASGGLGVFIADELAKAGVNLCLVANPGEELPILSQQLARRGVRVRPMVFDLRSCSERKALIEQARAELGSVDILVNNAGVEFNAPFHELSEEQIAEVLSVNLEAPMMLAHILLPHYLSRGQGHIVNISSLAGKSGPALQEAYAASKAALIAFTSSLRATYRGTGVSASVVTPGFVKAGIYERLKQRAGRDAPLLLGACPPERVALAVLRAIRNDRPEIIVNKYPVRPILLLSVLSPSLGEWLAARMGTHAFFRSAVESSGKSLRPKPITPKIAGLSDAL
jgi:short-subunit dehydrogenase